MDSNKPPDSTVRESCDRIPTHELALIRSHLQVASAVACVCSMALDAQAADHDPEVAMCLERCVVHSLYEQVQHINRLLGEDDGSEEDGGQL